MLVGEPSRSERVPRRVCPRTDRLPDTTRTCLLQQQQHLDAGRCSAGSRSTSSSHLADVVQEPVHPEHERGRSASMSSLSLQQGTSMVMVAPVAAATTRSPSPKCPPPPLSLRERSDEKAAVQNVQLVKSEGQHASPTTSITPQPLASAPSPPPALSSGALSSSSSLSTAMRGNEQAAAVVSGSNGISSVSLFDAFLAKHSSSSPLPSRRGSSRGGSSRSSHDRPAETESGATSTSTSLAHEHHSRTRDGGCAELSTTVQLTTSSGRTRDPSRPRPVRLQAAGLAKAAVASFAQESPDSTPVSATAAVSVSKQHPAQEDTPATSPISSTKATRRQDNQKDDGGVAAAQVDCRPSVTHYGHSGFAQTSPLLLSVMMSGESSTTMVGMIRTSMPFGSTPLGPGHAPLQQRTSTKTTWDADSQEYTPWHAPSEGQAAAAATSLRPISNDSHDFVDVHVDPLVAAVERTRRQMANCAAVAAGPPQPYRHSEADADQNRVSSRSSSVEPLPGHEPFAPTPLQRVSVGEESRSRLYVALARAGLQVRSVKAPALPSDGSRHSDPRDEGPMPNTDGPPAPQPRDVGMLTSMVAPANVRTQPSTTATTSRRRRRRVEKKTSGGGCS